MNIVAKNAPKSYARIIAFVVDLVFIYVYIAVLLGASILIDRLWPFHSLMESSYIFRHIISFLSLSLPIVIYFIWMERSERQATFGKSIMGLKVTAIDGDKASLKNLIIRNGLKFLPWEIAHTIIHIDFEILIVGGELSTGSMIGLIIPQVLVIGYVGMILIRKDKKSFYELMSGTKVVGGKK